MNETKEPEHVRFGEPIPNQVRTEPEKKEKLNEQDIFGSANQPRTEPEPISLHKILNFIQANKAILIICTLSIIACLIVAYNIGIEREHCIKEYDNIIKQYCTCNIPGGQNEYTTTTLTWNYTTTQNNNT